MRQINHKFAGAFKNGFDGCLLVSDLDGTLIGSEGSGISDGNIAAIQAFVVRGGRFIGATGRTELSVLPFTQQLPLSYPWILYNGAAIYDWKSQRFLYKAPLDRSLAEAFTRRVMRQLPSVNIQVYCGGPFCQVNVGASRDSIAAQEDQPLVDKVVDTITDDWLKVLFCSDFPEELDAVEALFESDALRGKAHKMRSAARYFEFTAPGITKGSALARLRALLDPAPKCIVAIGDYINDIEMLNEADIAAVPENAHADVKRHAAIITACHTQNAVADLLRRLENV